MATRNEAAQKLADIILEIVLKNGIVCETNETEQLFNQPTHNYTKELIRLMPKIESLV